MTERKGTFKVEFLKNIEAECQQNWDKLKIFEEDAPDDGSKGTPEEKWVAPCHFCTFLPDQFFLALFCLNIVSWIPCGAFWPNLATSAHFKGLFYPWMDSGVNLGPKFQLKPWANFSNFFGSFCT